MSYTKRSVLYGGETDFSENKKRKIENTEKKVEGVAPKEPEKIQESEDVKIRDNNIVESRDEAQIMLLNEILKRLSLLEKNVSSLKISNISQNTNVDKPRKILVKRNEEGVIIEAEIL